MFKLLRLFGRKDHIDDVAAAYIEGRATERDQAELRERSGKEPGLFRDLDSIRETVSLLRSVEPVQAPRSFALVEAPVQVRVKRPRMAMAPAVFAIAAAAVVGLLAVGSLADVVRQNDSSSSGTGSSGSSADSVAMRAGGAESADSIVGPEGPPGAPEQDGSTGTEEIATGAGAFSSATATPAASQPVAPMATIEAAGGDTAASLAPEFSTTVDSGSATPATRLPFVEPGRDGTVDLKGSEALTTDDVLPLPESTATGLFSLSGSSQLAAAEQENVKDDEGGFALPLWQLQVLFASIAVLMAGAWMLLQRKLTA